MPVFVPEDSGYFAEADVVVKSSVQSALDTTGDESVVTVVVNAAGAGLRRELELIVLSCGRGEVVLRAWNAGRM